jgi:hypothetical protein
MSVDPRFERFVLTEFALRERRGLRADRSHRARVLAERLHHGRNELLAHLRRFSYRVPGRFRRVAWLHHARLDGARPTGETLAALLLLPDPRLAK